MQQILAHQCLKFCINLFFRNETNFTVIKHCENQNPVQCLNLICLCVKIIFSDSLTFLLVCHCLKSSVLTLLFFLHLVASPMTHRGCCSIVTAPGAVGESSAKAACLFKFQTVEIRWKMKGDGGKRQGLQLLSSCLQVKGRAG